jgi:hypothetical protein
MIQLKKIEIYIVEEDTQNLLLHMASDKKSFKKTQIQNPPLHASSIEKPKQISLWNCSIYDDDNNF